MTRSAPMAVPASGRWRRRLSAALVLLAGSASSGFTGCGEDDGGVDNPSFDRWCTDRPCDWDLDLGHVSSVTTWHREDRAVSFEPGSDAQISQLQPRSTARCLRFDVIAKVGKDASLVLRLDFDDDQVFEREQVVPEVQWQSVPVTVPTPAVYDSVRFILLKQGNGTALVAQIVVGEAENCPDSSFLRTPGPACNDDDACGSGVCLAGRCHAEAARQREESE